MNAPVNVCPCCGQLTLGGPAVLLDPDSRSVSASGQVAHLTGTEFTIFQALWTRRGRTFGREQLLALTHRDYAADDERSDQTPTTHVSRIRKKLRSLGIKIEKVWGSGYRIPVDADRAGTANRGGMPQ